MGISLGNDNMFLSRSYEVNSTGTCTENPRVGSSILSLGTIMISVGYAYCITFLLLRKLQITPNPPLIIFKIFLPNN